MAAASAGRSRLAAAVGLLSLKSFFLNLFSTTLRLAEPNRLLSWTPPREPPLSRPRRLAPATRQVGPPPGRRPGRPEPERAPAVAQPRAGAGPATPRTTADGARVGTPATGSIAVDAPLADQVGTTGDRSNRDASSPHRWITTPPTPPPWPGFREQRGGDSRERSQPSAFPGSSSALATVLGATPRGSHA